MAFHYSTQQKRPSGSRKIMRQMLALIPALVIAAVCYSASVAAWFQASIVNSGNVIQTTTYNVAVEIIGPDDNKIKAASDGGYSLAANTEYTVSLTAAGGGERGGYCMIQPQGEEPLYTSPIAPNQSLSFTLIPDKEQIYTFTAFWGKYAGDGKIITSEAVIGTEPAAPSNEQADPTNDTESSETVGSIELEQQITSQTAESSLNPAETTTAAPPNSDSTSAPSSTVTSELQSSEPAALDTTNSQAGETETTIQAASEPDDTELIQTESEPVDPVETE